MTPTKQAELKVQLEHAAQVTRRLRQPERGERMGFAVVAVIGCVGFGALMVIASVLFGAR